MLLSLVKQCRCPLISLLSAQYVLCIFSSIISIDVISSCSRVSAYRARASDNGGNLARLGKRRNAYAAINADVYEVRVRSMMHTEPRPARSRISQFEP